MSSIYCSSITPSRTIVVSFTPRQKTDVSLDVESLSDYEKGDWVLCLACAPKTISCALSNGNVQVYDQNTLFPVHSYIPVNNGALVTDMMYGQDFGESSLLWTSGCDGSVVAKDFRQPESIIAQSVNISSLKDSSSHESALSLALGLDGNVLAVSTSRARIHFLDVRKMPSTDIALLLLGTYVNSHNSAITQVRFHPTDSSLLLSAGEDGLACIYNITKPSEDQALESVMNIGVPCRRIGFCDSGNHIYCLTGSETVSVWDWNAATCLNNFGNFGVRNTLKSLSSLPIDYLVDATWDPMGQEFVLCAGNNSGNMAVFHCEMKPNSSWHLRDRLTGGHHGVVRDWCPVVDNGGISPSTVMFSAGEDARLCEWKREKPSLSHLPPEDVSMTTSHETPAENKHSLGRSNAPIRRQRRDTSAAAAKPY